MRFKPSLALTLSLIPLACLTAWLGFWQLDRKAEKQAMVEQFENAQELELGEAIAASRQFARVTAYGRYDTQWSLLLDNKTLDGQVGVHVLTLFYPDHGEAILVNRGWLPMAPDRRSLPEVITPSGLVTIKGILNMPPGDGIRLGSSSFPDSLRGPVLITYLEMDKIAPLLDQRLSPWSILLDSADLTGFGGRQWQPAVILPAQHGAYAIQWFALSLAILIIWITLSRQRARRFSAQQEAREVGKRRSDP